MITQVINSKDPNVLMIEFMMGNLCNYKCSYCFPGSNEGDHSWPEINLLIKNLDCLLSKYINVGKNKFEFFLIGGEPTLWKDLPKLCYHLKSNYNTLLRISTNGSRKIDWWEANGKYFDQIELSVHHEFVKVPHIIEVADLMYEQNRNVVANVLMDPTKFEHCQNIIAELSSSKHVWPILAKAVHFSGKTRYTEEQTEFVSTQIKRYPNMDWWNGLAHNGRTQLWVVEDGIKRPVENNWITLNSQNKFYSWQCNLGLDHIEIFVDGRISGTCAEYIYGKDFYYNLYDADFIKKFDPVIGPVKCSRLLCQCGHEIMINKIKL